MTFLVLFLMRTMISTIIVTAIPVAKIVPTVLPAIHPPPQPDSIYTYVCENNTYLHTTTYAYMYTDTYILNVRMCFYHKTICTYVRIYCLWTYIRTLHKKN